MGLQLRGTPQPPLLLRTAAGDGADAAGGHRHHGGVAGEGGRARTVVRAPARPLGGGSGDGGVFRSGGADRSVAGGPLAVCGGEERM